MKIVVVFYQSMKRVTHLSYVLNLNLENIKYIAYWYCYAYIAYFQVFFKDIYCQDKYSDERNSDKLECLNGYPLKNSIIGKPDCLFK